MAMRMRRPQGWLATLTLSVGVLTIAGTVLQGRAADKSAADTKRTSGIYLETEAGGKDEPKRLGSTMAQVTPEGLGASMATMGFKKPKLIAKMSGDKATLRIPTQSSFLFVFGATVGRGPSPDMANMDPTTMMSKMNDSMSQLPAQTSIKDYALVQLTGVDGQRTYNSGDAKQVKYSVDKVDAITFHVKPQAPLAPGEYGFIISSNPGLVWDFGVDGAATK
jgi:hypothetical protein